MFCTQETYFYKQIYKMITEGQEMEIYQIFVVPMGNYKTTKELKLQSSIESVRQNTKKKSRNHLDGEESTRNSESPGDKIEEENECLVVQVSEKYKITKEYIKTQKVNNKSNLISQLEPSALT